MDLALPSRPVTGESSCGQLKPIGTILRSPEVLATLLAIVEDCDSESTAITRKSEGYKNSHSQKSGEPVADTRIKKGSQVEIIVCRASIPEVTCHGFLSLVEGVGENP